MPDGSAAVILPLGCGFGVSLLAVLPAVLALALGFTLPAVLLAAAAAGVLGGVLLRRGVRLRGMAKDANCGALWACILPVVLITLYLLHTHVLHMVNGAYHTGQSCYGDMPMHLGFIKYIAQSGEFLPCYPLLGGEHRFGYPFLCETASSVFLVLGADLRTAYLLPMLPAFLSVYGMFWQLARRVTDSAAKASLAFYLFFMGSGFGFVYFLGSAEKFAGIFTGFYTTPTNFVEQNIEWVNPIVDLLIPQRATLFGWCVLFPAVYLLWRFCYEGKRRLWPWLALLGAAPAAFAYPQCAGAGAFVPCGRRIHSGAGCTAGDAFALAGAGGGVRRGVAGADAAHRAGPKPGRSAHAAAALQLDQRPGRRHAEGQLFLVLHQKHRACVSAAGSCVYPRQAQTAVALRRRAGNFGAGGVCCVPAQQLRQ